jgi:hypothetical protein
MLTFWKPEELPSLGSMEVRVEPLGPCVEVINKLLSIPRSRPYLSQRILDGYVAIWWNVENGVVLDFKSEPELGKDEVYSLKIERKMVHEAQFLRYYILLYEMFGVVLLDESGFVTVNDYKGKI